MNWKTLVTTLIILVAIRAQEPIDKAIEDEEKFMQTLDPKIAAMSKKIDKQKFLTLTSEIVELLKCVKITTTTTTPKPIENPIEAPVESSGDQQPVEEQVVNPVEEPVNSEQSTVEEAPVVPENEQTVGEQASENQTAESPLEENINPPVGDITPTEGNAEQTAEENTGETPSGVVEDNPIEETANETNAEENVDPTMVDNSEETPIEEAIEPAGSAVAEEATPAADELTPEDVQDEVTENVTVPESVPESVVDDIVDSALETAQSNVEETGEAELTPAQVEDIVQEAVDSGVPAEDVAPVVDEIVSNTEDVVEEAAAEEATPASDSISPVADLKFDDIYSDAVANLTIPDSIDFSQLSKIVNDLLDDAQDNFAETGCADISPEQVDVIVQEAVDAGIPVEDVKPLVEQIVENMEDVFDDIVGEEFNLTVITLTPTAEDISLFDQMESRIKEIALQFN